LNHREENLACGELKFSKAAEASSSMLHDNKEIKKK
jgi:hypothetical protein